MAGAFPISSAKFETMGVQSIQNTIIGIVIGVIFVHTCFYFSKKFLLSKVNEKSLFILKSFFEYTLIVWAIYYIFF